MATHGMSGTKTYCTWQGLVSRCRKKDDKDYPNYGGRGITVCKEWLKFEGFYKDMGKRPKGKTIERIDVNGPYDFWNCRWATVKEQNRNRRNNRTVKAFGKIRILQEWADEFKINKVTLLDRLNRGWKPEIAVSAPAHHGRKEEYWRKKYKGTGAYL